MRGSPVFIPNFIQICSYIIEKKVDNRKKRLNLGTRPVELYNPKKNQHFIKSILTMLCYLLRYKETEDIKEQIDL